MVLAYRIQADVLRSAEEDKSKEIKARVGVSMKCGYIRNISQLLHNALEPRGTALLIVHQAALSTAEGLAREHIAKFNGSGDKRSEAVLLLAAGEINYNKRGPVQGSCLAQL